MSGSQQQTLVKMANQIAANLGAYPHNEAVTRMTNHLKRFWAPQMRRQLVALSGDAALSPVTQAVIAELEASRTYPETGNAS